MKKVIISILTYIVIMLLATTVYGTEGTVNTETARMRSNPSADASIVELISMSENVDVIEETGDWYKIQYKGKTGYISKSLLDVEGSVSSTTGTSNEQENTTSNATTNGVAKEETNTDTSNSTVNQASEQTELELKEAYIGSLTSEVTIKILPSINSTDIDKIETGKQITVIEILNDWCYIQTDSQLGWVRVEIITAAISKTEETQEPEAPKEKENENKAKVGYVNVETVNVRKDKSTSSEIVDNLRKNTEVTILDKEENWYKVQAGSTTGYIFTKYISDEKVPETTSRAIETARQIEEVKKQDTAQTVLPNTSVQGAEVVTFAKKYLGTKYVSGGSNPVVGFDCSGFTSYVYKNFGVSLSRSSSGQAKNGTSVAKANLQPGDLLIFNNSANKTVGHVGIYIGNNQFIHAANGSKGVVTTSLSNSYYVTRYVDAKRVF